MVGRTIEIYLPEANPRGIRECNIKDSIVKAIVIPRNQISELSKIDELKEPGVYFLIKDEQNFEVKPEIYIGETDDLRKRIKQHQAKDWNLAICFFSTKRNMNKAHVKYLEGHCCEIAKEINKCTLHNETKPTKSPLNNQERDLVLSFFNDLKIIIGTLGFPIFDTIKKERKNVIYCKGKDALSQGSYSEDGLLVFKGSKANLKESKSSGTWVINMREKLKDEGILKEQGTVLEFTEDYLFKSPSAAAAVILARRANGWTEWKTKDKKTIDETIRQTN